jgi:hypothetical protein
MHRPVASLLCAAVACAAFAAPAPVYRPKASRVWFTGWDKPVDLTGDCRFHRDGEVLTIAVRGRSHAKDGWAKIPDGPGRFARSKAISPSLTNTRKLIHNRFCGKRHLHVVDEFKEAGRQEGRWRMVRAEMQNQVLSENSFSGHVRSPTWLVALL